jgi:inactivated superfamily I helicase
MLNLTHTNAITEGRAMNAIFDACRANEKREPKNGVTFNLLVNGNHEAALRDADGVVVALAEVDALDC